MKELRKSPGRIRLEHELAEHLFIFLRDTSLYSWIHLILCFQLQPILEDSFVAVFCVSKYFEIYFVTTTRYIHLKGKDC